MNEINPKISEDKIHFLPETPSGVTIVHQKSDDTLRYKVSVSKAVAQDTVRVISTITALVNPQETTEKVLGERVQLVLNNFINGDWVISDLERRADAAGYERITMKASARVSFTENFNLSDRARTANREGISISDTEVNRSASPEKVRLVVKELWFKIIELINDQIPQFNALTDRVWRIGDVEYGQPDRDRGGEQRFSKGATRNEVNQFFSESDDPSVKQGGERINLVANVTLRATPS